MTQSGYALVTGASRGLGRCFARALAARGQNLVLVARSEALLQTLTEELKQTYQIEVEPIVCDLATENAGEQLADALLARNLTIDLLVNNAGGGKQGWFLELGLRQQLDAVHLQNTTIVELVYKLTAPMIERGRGGIINVSSMAGWQPIPYATIYSSAKSFLTTFSLALEAEVGPQGVAVVTLCPGHLRKSGQDVNPATDNRKAPGGDSSQEEVVAAALRKLDEGGGLVIPGTRNKLTAFAERFVPRRKEARLVGKFSKPKR